MQDIIIITGCILFLLGKVQPGQPVLHHTVSHVEATHVASWEAARQGKARQGRAGGVFESSCPDAALKQNDRMGPVSSHS